ncbi:sn-glycerol-3-phosphate ABC transporter ATP-binding protein UgpC [Marinovum sp. 2_MG-2023]|uniref:ABC transporter ATP-binding protein n=1 Tax=unclassified Marinovum TaxID=2647166 RepID=UPI0026E3BAA1|nr:MULTISPECIES: sn-glycerol-3-phosphate ABC transporter ATP-binding protein UgpC [unclassified Marinovum]MDO6729262.1 sn-glycerol-3-phosphate ABC transporter ATP-binding protein UgpC [Marinovum sp. 2_MG-2023]MDO6779111.1 sn-glycerol-3-phosphate ABC transporter ATP-binding protein UgpC [Marinovum sp. 1_MG-2023]
MASVEINNLVKKFGELEVLQDISLTIPDGEFAVIVGASGSGKSTLLRLISGLEGISSGTMKFGDRVVNDLAPVERGVAMVFQSYALYPHMSVFENMAFGMRERREPKEQIQQKVEAAAKILQIGHLLDRKPKQLSGGQMQRVAIGRAIVRDPSVFLFDEPLSNLDASLRATMRVELKKLHRELGATMVYVTHDQIEAMTMADKIFVMHEGKVEQFGPPREVFSKPASVFVATFIGSPKTSILPCRAETPDGAQLRMSFADGETLSTSIPEGAAVSRLGDVSQVGVRPDDWQILPETAQGLDVRIANLEDLGAELLLQVDSPYGEFTIRQPFSDMHAVGDQLRLGIKPGTAHLFDSDGKRV